ncbi:MAG: AAA family ATPase [Bacteroidales bacterium]|nr:AAA family ATPase [Bacteroidales bacterium]
MIISEIHIDGFGVFHGLSIRNLKKGINIILGDNEAGKSTLLKFLRFTLFGYPSKRKKEDRMQPLFGGNHGGRIKSVISSGKEAIFDRKGDNQLILTFDGNISSNETQWLQLLGNSTEDIYKNVFAFSLDELLDMHSLSISGVENKIFSISAGLGNISIGDVVNEIQKSIDQIYIPRGSVQRIPIILSEIQDKKSGLKKLQDNLPRYQDLTAELKGIEDEIFELKRNLKDDRTEKEKNENYLKCYESAAIVVSIDKKLEELPKAQNYPKGGLDKLDELEKGKNYLNERIDELQKGSVGEKSIEEIEEELKSLSYNNAILKEKVKVNHLKTNLEKYKQALVDRSEIVQKINRLNVDISSGLQNIRSGWIEQNIIAFSEIIPHQDKVKGYKEKFGSIDKERIELKGQEKGALTSGGRINTNNFLILISLVLILTSVGAFYYSLHVIGIITVVVAFLVFFSRRYLLKESNLEKLLKKLVDIDYEDKQIKESYGNYLENELSLERTLSIDTVTEILKIIELLKNKIIERDDMERKQKETKDPFIHGFEEIVRSAGDLLIVKEPESDIETLTNKIIEEFDYAEKESKKESDLKEVLSSRKKELEKNENKLTENNLKFTILLESINAKDGDDFRGKYAVNDEVKDLMEKRRNAITTIESIIGPNKADDVISYLKTHEQKELFGAVADLADNIASKEEKLSLINNELGEKNKEISMIEGESELAEKMTEFEIERQKLNDAYRDWITGKIALKVLTDVRGKYEKEKQPVIIQNSSRYFDKITGGNYKRIHVSLEKRDITVFDSREAYKNIDQLSRGTREQLLISLRMGFIEEYETKAESLPVIVDEILVNFDPTRAKRIAKIFQDFGKHRQIIVFTCHPSIIEYFDKAAINLRELKNL